MRNQKNTLKTDRTQRSTVKSQVSKMAGANKLGSRCSSGIPEPLFKSGNQNTNTVKKASDVGVEEELRKMSML